MERYIDLSNEDQSELLLKLIRAVADKQSQVGSKQYFEIMFSCAFRGDAKDEDDHFLDINYKKTYPELFSDEEFKKKLGKAAENISLDKDELKNAYFEMSDVEARCLPELAGLKFLIAKNHVIAKTLARMFVGEKVSLADQNIKTELYRYALIVSYLTGVKVEELYEEKFNQSLVEMTREINNLLASRS